MAWIEPKTDWKSSDYFNPEDFNRITGNIMHIKELADSLYLRLSNIGGFDTKDYTSLIYADEFNGIENSIYTLNDETYKLKIGTKKTYYVNKATPTWEDFNRIENGILLLYKMMMAQKEALKRLPFTLKGQKGIRV